MVKLSARFILNTRGNLLVGAAKNFAGEITLRFPTVVAEAQCHRAGFVLAKKFNAPSLQFLGPRIADSLVIGKIARSGYDQAGARSIEERF